jgi:hypothetical protein
MNGDVTLMLVGALVSATVTLLVAWWASRDARRSLHQTGLLLRGMEEAGLVKWNRDDRGNPIGIQIDLKIHDSLHAMGSMRADLKVNRSGDEAN